MRWPSVHVWGWIVGLPGLLLGFCASLGLAALEVTLARRLFGVTELPFFAYFVVTFLGLMLLAMKLVDCPRCGVSAYWHSATRWSNAWPEKTCSKCGLDLRRHSPFDPKAKTAPVEATPSA